MNKLNSRRWLYSLFAAIVLIAALIWSFNNLNLNPSYSVGQPIDSFNGVSVFYNGGVNSHSGRNLAEDGYNLGLNYQCVEFVKRYYYQHFKHKMPDSYGHAKDFFDRTLADGAHNKQRNLLQYNNPSKTKPQAGDILIFSASLFNPYGHVAIISKVTPTQIEIVQQNPGPFASSRENFSLEYVNKQWQIKHQRILGRLRLAAANQNTNN